jgi:hypothetical protein
MRMLVTKEWSEPKQLEYGKDILVRSSRGNFNYKVYSANGETIQGTIHGREHIITASDEFFRVINSPMLCFRANTNDELHVEFEQL